MATQPDRTEDFVQEMNAHQRSLYAYILKLMPNTREALDVLQETNLILWRQREQYQAGTSFGAWAARIAYFSVLTYRKKCQRDRLCLTDEVVELIAADSAGDAGKLDERHQALGKCLQRLSEEDQQLLKERYVADRPAREIAGKIGRSPHAVAQALYRIRAALRFCIEESLATEGKMG